MGQFKNQNNNYNDSKHIKYEFLMTLQKKKPSKIPLENAAEQFIILKMLHRKYPAFIALSTINYSS